MTDPARTIPRAIVLTCLITGLLASVEVYLAQLVWLRGLPFLTSIQPMWQSHNALAERSSVF
jgi:hypothetical protein